jgi:2,3-bisphosphoglycerate-dependent phosphoglycerate mutase
MQLYYIRHAQSENNALWEATGSDEGRSSDPELTEIGKQQITCLAQFLKTGDPVLGNRRMDAQNLAGFGLTHLYCSLMVQW